MSTQSAQETIVFEGYTGAREHCVTVSDAVIRIYREIDDDEGDAWFEEASVSGVDDWREALYRHCRELPQMPQELPPGERYRERHGAEIDRLNRLPTQHDPA